MEVVFLPFLFAAYGIAIVEKAFFPDPRLRMSERVSKSHGWSLVAIRLTRSTQSFTLYGELWHILGILDPERFQFTAIVLQIAVFLAYHGLRTVDPSYLSYDPEVVKLLIDRGAVVDTGNGFSATPLHLAAEAGQVANMRLLIARGADVNARQADKSTPLALAAKHNEPDCVKLLLLRGAKTSARDSEGHTPLWLAKDARLRLVRGDTRQIVKMLKMAGAKE